MKIDKSAVIEIIKDFDFAPTKLLKAINALPASEDEWVSVDVSPKNNSDVIVELGNGSVLPAKYLDGRYERYLDQITHSSSGVFDRIMAIYYPTVKRWTYLPSPPTKP